MSAPHGMALRKGRVSTFGQIYLVTTVTRGRKPIFMHLSFGRLLINAMQEHAGKGNVDSLAFVVMPDHLHWLFALTGQTALSKLVGQVKGASSYWIRHVGAPSGVIEREIAAKAAPTGGSGSIWQEGFYDRALRRDEDIRSVARYIVMNPVRRGLVKRIWDYPLWDAVWVE